ncbi:MAG: CDP-alcohol phosphatidyltransferase family protein [Terriglobia bacterium]
MKAVLLNLSSGQRADQLSLAGLPLLLRTVLSAQRAGIEEIHIIGGEHPGRLLGRDKRVKVKWHWTPLAAPHNSPTVRDTLGRVADDLSEEFVLLFADSIFDPKALAELRAAGLNGKAARVAVPAGATDLVEASLYLCSPKFFRLLAEADRLEGIKALAARLRQQGRLDTVAVSGRLWPRTTSRKQLRLIHHELTRSNLKPSDGIFAKFNKLVVAEPLIRAFLRTPATPNFITGLGLFFALWSGWAFAQGSYDWSITGALLAYLSAIMDHVDGMVARLKFLESKFGVWFESAVDFTSNLFIFGGLALGLYRETGFTHHLMIGGLFVFGTIASFITTSWQRKLASADNPTDYPNRIHAKLEAHQHNFFHWFTRKCYFLVRRAVLPYFILLFCLLDWRVLLLGWVTFGANLVWLLTLYNNRLFRVPHASQQARENIPP